MRTEGFSCSLDVLYGGLEIRTVHKLHFLIQNFLFPLVMKTMDLDPDPDPHPGPHYPKMLNPDPDPY